jgi:Ca2+-binding EF-hand superfamily protein
MSADDDDDISSEASATSTNGNEIMAESSSQKTGDSGPFSLDLESEAGGDANAAREEDVSLEVVSLESSSLPLTEAQTIECMKAFAVYDQHEDGKVSLEDFAALLRSLNENLTDEDIAKIVSNMTTPDGEVDTAAFLEIMAQIYESDVVKTSFGKFDKDGDGTISETDVQNAIKMLGENVTNDELRDIIYEIKDESGKIGISLYLATMLRKRAARRKNIQENISRLQKSEEILELKFEKAMFEFTSLDINGDGIVTKERIAILSRSLDPNITELEISEFIIRTSGSDELVRKNQFSAFIREKIERDEIQCVFTQFAQKDEEIINIEDLSSAMEQLGIGASTIIELEEIARELSDVDGKISLEVFLRFMAQRRRLAKEEIVQQKHLEPRKYIGREIKRNEGPRKGCQGRIISFQADLFTGTLLYMVLYENGDEEYLDIDEIHSQLLPLNLSNENRTADRQKARMALAMHMKQRSSKFHRKLVSEMEMTKTKNRKKSKKLRSSRLDNVKNLIKLTSFAAKSHSQADADGIIKGDITENAEASDKAKLGSFDLNFQPVLVSIIARFQ